MSAQHVLEYLERANLFIVPLDSERRWYRYHHLFQQVLNERLVHCVNPETVVNLHVRAAHWFDQHNLVVDAVQHALAAQDWEHVADLTEAHGLALMTRGHVYTVLRWLITLPELRIVGRPYLTMVHADALFYTNQLDTAEIQLQAAEALLLVDAHDDRSATIRAYTASLRASIARFRSELAHSSILARRV